MVTNLEQMRGANLSSSENIFRAVIEKAHIWLVDQIGKHFPQERHCYLLKRWQKLEPLFQNLVDGLGGKKVRSSLALSSLVSPLVPSAAAPLLVDASPPPVDDHSQ
jgi:hypothetical protein